MLNDMVIKVIIHIIHDRCPSQDTERMFPGIIKKFDDRPNVSVIGNIFLSTDLQVFVSFVPCELTRLQ